MRSGRRIAVCRLSRVPAAGYHASPCVIAAPWGHHLADDRHSSESPAAALRTDAYRPERPLAECVAAALAHYFELLDGQPPTDLYELVMGEVEAPLLRAVLAHVGDNQCRAAELLGINRGTLRKKMKRHGLL